MQYGPPVSMKQNKRPMSLCLVGKALLAITMGMLHIFVRRRDPPGFHEIL